MVSTIEQGWIMDNQRKIFTKQYRLHYLDVMAINFILQLYMNDINHCPNMTYKHILRLIYSNREDRYLIVCLDVVFNYVYWKCNVVHRKKN